MVKNTYAIVVLFLSLISSVAMGNIDFEKEEEQAIYFCTKDINSAQFSLMKNPWPEKNYGKGAFLKIITKIDNNFQTNYRHCFMMLATKNGEDENGEIVYLNKEATRGYGGDGSNSAWSGIVTRGAAYEEQDLDRIPISCVPILEINDIQKDSCNMYCKWGKLMETMKHRSRTDYHAMRHNCCTVAYGTTIDIGGHVERVDPKEFNIYGMGIIWGEKPSYVVDITSSFISSPIIASKKSFADSSYDSFASGGESSASKSFFSDSKEEQDETDIRDL